MSVLVVGLSHKSAPVATLERAVVTGDTLSKLLRDVLHAEEVAGALVVSTCTRVEVYAEVEKFHGGLSAICELLARHAGVPLAELTPHLYVHYEDRAVQHLLSVACGLDSMVIGESQILGQARESLRLAREQGTLRRALSHLGSLALRAGKRAHAETGIGRAGGQRLGRHGRPVPAACRDRRRRPGRLLHRRSRPRDHRGHRRGRAGVAGAGHAGAGHAGASHAGAGPAGAGHAGAGATAARPAGPGAAPRRWS